MILFVKNLLFTILVPGMVAVFVPVFVITHGTAEVSVRAFGAGILLLIGSAVYVWCLWDFATAGRGTPAPIDPPKYLVMRGLYRHTRNPMYLGVLCIIAGWGLLLGSTAIAIYAVCVAVVVHLFVVLYEEPHLSKIFGASYGQYCSQVPRWLPMPRQRSAK